MHRCVRLILFVTGLCLSIVGGCVGRRPAPPPHAETASSSNSSEYVVVVKEYGNIRVTDSGRAAVLTRLPRGAKALVLTRNGKWYQVLDEKTNTLGWIHETYVEEVNP